MQAIHRRMGILGVLMASAVTAHGNEVPRNPTYSKDVAPILNANCVQCHRAGDIGPMSLTSYDEVRPWAKSIQQNVQSGTMPPWHAAPGIGEFKNDRSLEDWEVATIVNWAKRGAKQGDPANVPPLPDLPESGWRLGEPDMVVEFREVSLQAGGPDRFYDLSGETGLKEDRWLKAVEVMPGNRKVLHHVILWQGSQGNGWLGAWAAGMDPMKFPEGVGRKLKAGAPLVADMHYHPADTPETDQTRIGLHFADDTDIEKELINLWIQNNGFKIPAGDPDYSARSRFTFQEDAYIVSFLPHMHYRGKSFSYTARFPDGRSEKLLQVDDYDFNWQTVYEAAEPIFVPKGTRVECIARWDNSAENPDNPDPTRTVTFGNESYDEMMIGFVDYVLAEGRSQRTPEEAINALANELYEEHPGDVYRIDVMEGGTFFGAVVLPREAGTGTWHINLMGSLQTVPVEDLKWSGDRVTGTLSVVGQTFKVDATLDPDTNKISGSIQEPGNADNSGSVRGYRLTE